MRLCRVGARGVLLAPVSLGVPKKADRHEGVVRVAESCICEAFNYMLHFMDVTWGGVLSLDMDRLVPRLGDFAEALHSWGNPLDDCWGLSTALSAVLQGKYRIRCTGK